MAEVTGQQFIRHVIAKVTTEDPKVICGKEVAVTLVCLEGRKVRKLSGFSCVLSYKNCVKVVVLVLSSWLCWC